MRQNKRSLNHTLKHGEGPINLPSRTKLHKQNHNNNLVTIILTSIIILIAVFALIYGLANNSLDSLGHKMTHSTKSRVSKVTHRKKKHRSQVHKVTGDQSSRLAPKTSNSNGSQGNVTKSAPQVHSNSKVTDSGSSNSSVHQNPKSAHSANNSSKPQSQSNNHTTISNKNSRE